MKSEPGRDRISAAQLAAAEAIFDAWYNASHPMMRVPERIEEWREEASKLAVVAVAAIAAKGWGEAEAATRVLSDLLDKLDANLLPTSSTAYAIRRERDRARALVDERP